jgi:hypothetical protein
MKLKLVAAAALGLLAACNTVPSGVFVEYEQDFNGNSVLGVAPKPFASPPPQQITPEMVQSALPPPPLEIQSDEGQPLSSLTAEDSNPAISPMFQPTNMQ